MRGFKNRAGSNPGTTSFSNRLGTNTQASGKPLLLYNNGVIFPNPHTNSEELKISQQIADNKNCNRIMGAQNPIPQPPEPRPEFDIHKIRRDLKDWGVDTEDIQKSILAITSDLDTVAELENDSSENLKQARIESPSQIKSLDSTEENAIDNPMRLKDRSKESRRARYGLDGSRFRMISFNKLGYCKHAAVIGLFTILSALLIFNLQESRSEILYQRNATKVHKYVNKVEAATQNNFPRNYQSYLEESLSTDDRYKLIELHIQGKKLMNRSLNEEQYTQVAKSYAIVDHILLNRHNSNHSQASALLQSTPNIQKQLIIPPDN